MNLAYTSPAKPCTADRSPPRHAAMRAAVIAMLAASALLLLWTSLIAIANFAFRYPAFDQFRMYGVYLGLPFPANAIQSESGHRPILPTLVRLAEMRWLASHQVTQVTIGVVAALLALILIVATILREKSLPAISRTAACVLAVIALFWLGNARMLMHGNELLHTYFVVLFTVSAVIAVDAARRRQPLLGMSIAGVCCLAATFSFGTGMASFGAVLLLGACLRMRWRELAIPAALLFVTLAIYLLILPGNDGVRGTLLFDPLGNLVVLARWLSSPWMRAWLGQADPPIEPWLQSTLSISSSGRMLVASARLIAVPFGADSAMRESVALGGAGLCAFVILLIHAVRHGASLNATRALALGLATFAFGSAVIVCFARLQLFEVSPGQIFADRYLPWSCLFWFGLALYAASAEGSSRWRTTAFACATALTLLIFLPTQRALAGWSAAVYRHVQLSAVAAQLGVWDPEQFNYAPASTDEEVRAGLDLLRQRHLSMFSEPAFGMVERSWRAPTHVAPTPAGASTHVVREFTDAQSHRHIAEFEGWMPRIHGIARNPVLVVVDERGALRGLAKLSFIGPGKEPLRFNIARKRGFSGYVLDAEAGEQLSVLVLDASHTNVLATMPLRLPVAAPASDGQH
jgi:hypothetical protein